MGRIIYELVRRFWYVCFRGTHKNNHLLFFLKSYAKYCTPKWIKRYQRTCKLNRFYKLNHEEQEYIQRRVDYYCKFNNQILLPDEAPSLKQYTYRKKESFVHDYINSTYFFDAYEYTRFFPDSLRWAYNPGDVNYIFPLPEITKSRPLTPDNGNQNNILLNLDKVRHFTWVADPFKWEEKECRIIFRGDAIGKPHRLRFIEMWRDHPLCDLISTGKMPLYDHLHYRYIMALEGNDVASNLKWVMSSNSIAVMPRPTCETWYMEGQLIPNYHYIEIASDYHDLIDRISYYEAHPDEAKAIVEHAHEWVRQFQNHKREELISLMVLDKYFRLTGQTVSSKQPISSDKYIVNEVVKLSFQQQVNAQGKARTDVVHTAKSLGFQVYDITNYKYSYGEGQRPHHYPFFSHWMANSQGKKFVKNIKADDTIIIQEFYVDYMQNIATECLRRGAKVIFLVHDVQCIRFNKKTSEINKLNNASLLLVHTEAMKQKLTDLGVTTPMRIIHLFDYYSKAPMASVEDTIQHKHDIVFAGNLAKSEFLKDLLVDDTNENINFKLYGILGDLNLNGHTKFSYHGVFSPDDTSTIHGGWGLVWDGYNIYSCTGDYGNYLRYNSSHKFSLYLTCGIPVIVWDQSAIANWVTKEGFGIVVPSLKHIDSVISAISEEEYRQMVMNARHIGQKLREGYYLKKSLNGV